MAADAVRVRILTNPIQQILMHKKAARTRQAAWEDQRMRWDTVRCKGRRYRSVLAVVAAAVGAA